MNAIFILSIISSLIVLTFFGADKVVAAMQSSATDALKLSGTLLCIYAVWLGVFEIADRIGITKKLSKLLKKPLSLLFGDMKDAEDATCVCITANLLGLSGVATPLAIKATTLFDRAKNEYAKTMLFVLSATSLQLLPISVIALRASNSSAAPSSIVLPTLISTFVSTAIGVVLVKIFVKK